MENYVGQQLGNYKLIRLLGEGGFAEVYLGEHGWLGMKAAIRVLHTILETEHVSASQQEAKMIAEYLCMNNKHTHCNNSKKSIL